MREGRRTLPEGKKLAGPCEKPGEPLSQIAVSEERRNGSCEILRARAFFAGLAGKLLKRLVASAERHDESRVVSDRTGNESVQVDESALVNRKGNRNEEIDSTLTKTACH